MLPERPIGTEALSEDQLLPLITREAMVCVAAVAHHDLVDGHRYSRGATNGELGFAEPWRAEPVLWLSVCKTRACSVGRNSRRR